MNFARPAGVLPARSKHLDLNVSRAGIFACAGVLAALNALGIRIIFVVNHYPSVETLVMLGGVSAVIWFAMYAALKIGFEAAAEPTSGRDLAVVGAVVLLSLVPVSLAARAALLLCAGYLLATSRPGQPARAIAFVLLALTGPLIWGHILLDLFARPLLSLDAHLVAFAIRTPVDGNVVRFSHSADEFLVAGGCSSVHNISLALVLWTTAAVLFRVKVDRGYVAFGAAMVALMFALNTARLSAIGLFPGSFDYLHHGAGAAMFGWGGLVGAASLAAIGVTRASDRQQ